MDPNGISVSTTIEPNNAIAPRQNIQATEKARNVNERAGSEPEDFPVKAEILTTTDIEIRKLHSLRRAKEYLEQKLENTAKEILDGGNLNGSSGPERTESAAAREYNVRVNDMTFIKDAPETDANDEIAASGVSYKTGSAITGYKAYKKDSPKSWNPGDVDEKR